MIRLGTLDSKLPERVPAYYVGRTDPKTGLFTHERLALDGCYHLIELAPSPALLVGWSAVGTVRMALASGALAGRTQADVNRWLQEQPTDILRYAAERTFKEMKGFLSGVKLEGAELRFRELYLKELGDDALAALTWLYAEDQLGEVFLLDEGTSPTASVVRDKVTNAAPRSQSNRNPHNSKEETCLSTVSTPSR